MQIEAPVGIVGTRAPAPRHLQLGLIAVFAAALAGCAGPKIARWSAPPASVSTVPTNLDAGRAYADAARNAYQDEVASFVDSQGSTANLLLGTGALAMLLAASSGVHRDALLGTAFFGGTAYAFGNMNLSKQRALVHLAGVEAINCAKRAVAPLAMTITEQTAFDAALLALERNVRSVNSARAGLRRAVGPDTTAGQREAADAALTAAAAAVESAQRVQVSGRKLAISARSAGDQLIQAVDKIDASVIRAGMETLPDLTSVPRIVAGLSGFAASFAPGAGIDTAINNAIAQRPKAQSRAVGSAASNEFGIAMDELAGAIDSLLEATAVVQARLAGHESALVSDALKDCGVTDIAFPLRASSERIVFAGAGASSKSVVLSGGTKPYVVELQDSAIEGLTLKSPAPFESRLQVSISAAVKAPQTASVLVMDSSNPMKTLQLPIEIGTVKPQSQSAQLPDSPAAGQSTAAAPAGGVQTLQQLADRLTQKADFPSAEGFTLQLQQDVSLQSGASSLTAKVRCKPTPDKPITDRRAAEILASSVGLAADHELTRSLKVSGPPTCITASR